MVYSTVSIDEVIGRVVRNTRVQDSSYLLDASVWIPEAMGIMRTKVEVANDYQDVQIEFHVGQTPCGTITIKAVEWNGGRLPVGNSSRSTGAPFSERRGQSQHTFKTQLLAYPAPDGDGIIYNSTAYPLRTYSAEEAMALQECNAYYTTEPGYIQTSFADGCIRIHRTFMRLDENGFPQIPDNENYKQALYWWIRGNMIGTGWDDPVFRYDYCHSQFELYASRAMSSIRYPSVDMMDMRMNATVHLLPSPAYFSNFFFTPNETL